MTSLADKAVRARPRVAGERSRSRRVPSEPVGVDLRDTAGQRLRRVAGAVPDRAQPGNHRASTAVDTRASARPAPSQPESPLRRLAGPASALIVALALLTATLVVSLREPGADTSSGHSAAAAQAKLSLEQMLSFDYRTFDADSAKVQPLLAGPFRSEFTSTMAAQIKPLAQKSKSVVRARVYDVGVVNASERSVTVLAFVNQAKTSSDLERPAIDQNRVIATLTKVDGRWLISGLRAF